jgi:hypothetical protein
MRRASTAVMPPTPRLPSPPTRTFVLIGAVLVALMVASVGRTASGPAAPVLIGPADDISVESLPAFGWQRVATAANYEFEFSADPGFNSDIAHTTTKNTRATVKVVVPNGNYYWRVRGITEAGALGAWAPTRHLVMAWTAKPSLLSPAGAGTLVYPDDTIKLSWSQVPGAAKYFVRLATDPALGSLVWSTGPEDTAATTYTLSAPLAPGTYYWGITPLDAEGHAGTPSTVASFTLIWPSTTTPVLTDLAPAPEMFDPFFSWTRIDGASGYEVEVNSSSDWAAGSKVCCDPVRVNSSITTLGLSYAPVEAIDNNTYYWRVRGIDPKGNAGSWNVGTPFVKTFDQVPPVTAPSVKNLRMRDNAADPYTGVDPATVGYPVATSTPIVTWDPVPGASSYQVDVTPFTAGACDWSAFTSHWTKSTATTSWTPLGHGWNGVKPFPNPLAMSTDIPALIEGQSYCARVRPIDRTSTIAGPTIFGDYTYLPANNQAAFTWTDGSVAGACSCALSPGDYLGPQTGATLTRMPLFRWQPITGAHGYFVIVARDAAFTNVIDYAFTQVPAYAPRTGTATKGYSDELTLYYWAVLPATGANGSGVSANPLVGPANFQKQSPPPTLTAPASGAIAPGPVTFQWTPAEGARRYRVQVAQDPSFANTIDDVTTDSTAYTSNTTYPADTILYWRVRADAEDGSNYVGLTWSSALTFRKQLPAPVPAAGNPTSGAAIPTLVWDPVPGAVSYDVHVEEPDGDQDDFPNIPSHAITATKMTGTGIFTFSARANFPTSTGTLVHGPYSTLMPYARTIPEPTGLASDATSDHLVFSWDPRMATKKYRLQISSRPDFLFTVENVTTEVPVYAPLMTQHDYVDGGVLYWHVAAIDADDNIGDYSPVKQVGILQTMRLRTQGYLARGRPTTFTVIATWVTHPVKGAKIRIWGAGLTARVKATSSAGKVSFSIRPRKRGKLYIRATKGGFRTLNTYVVVRPAP